MQSRFPLAFLVFAALTGFFATSFCRAEQPKPLHFSLTEATYNRERGRLLVTVRVQTADLEAALSDRAQKKITVGEPGELAPLALEYVREKLLVTSARGEHLRLEWAGHDVTTTQLFLFFEAPLTGSVIGVRLSNSLLVERFPDQVNSVEISDGALKQTLVFSREKNESVVTAKP
ncbi:MAG: hypothetical protein QM790_13160 [Nibricoccus sp.]